MIRTLRTMVVAAVATFLALAWAVETDGGGRATLDERTAALARMQEVNAQARVRRALAELYQAVEPYVDAHVAIAAGYAPTAGCLASSLGAQGIRFVRDDALEPEVVTDRPQALLYEPRTDGSLRFVGVEYRVPQQAWHEAGHEDRPVLFGQTFGLSDTRLDVPFYRLHVWIGQFNPSGVFADQNPLVTCDGGEAVERRLDETRH